MASNKNKPRTGKRPYTLRARAKRHEAVHRRITLAAVQLHGTVGPARTTMGEIANRAGVRRATVYNHFPTELDLLDACSSHWFSENPPPDPAPWAEVSDPYRRVELALGEMYGYYESGRAMLGNVLRDAPLVTALDEIVRAKWLPLMDTMVEILSRGWSTGVGRTEGSGAEPGLHATLLVALNFFTWETMADAGLPPEEAARLAAAWVGAGHSSA